MALAATGRPGSRQNSGARMAQEMAEFMGKLNQVEDRGGGWGEGGECEEVLEEYGVRLDQHVAPTARGIARREDMTRVLSASLDEKMIEAVVARAMTTHSPRPVSAERQRSWVDLLPQDVLGDAADAHDAVGEFGIPSAEASASVLGRSRLLAWVGEQEGEVRARQALYDLNAAHAAHAPSFAVHLARIWRCEIPGVPLHNENRLLLKYVRAAGKEVPKALLNPAASPGDRIELLGYPVYSKYGRVEEAPELPTAGGPLHRKVLWDKRRTVLMWKLDTMLNHLRPPPPAMASSHEIKLKQSIERAVLAWQIKNVEMETREEEPASISSEIMHADVWSFLSRADTPVIESRYWAACEHGEAGGEVLASEKWQTVTTLSDSYRVDFLRMVAFKGRRALPIRRRWVSPTQSYSDAMFFWERVRMLCDDIADAEDNHALYTVGGAHAIPLGGEADNNNNLGAAAGPAHTATANLHLHHRGDVTSLPPETPLSIFSITDISDRGAGTSISVNAPLMSIAEIERRADLSWLQARESAERWTSDQVEMETRFDLERSCYEDMEGVGRRAVEQRDSKLRLALWCMEQEHRKNIDLARKRAAAEKFAEASKLFKLNEQKKLHALVVRAQEQYRNDPEHAKGGGGRDAPGGDADAAGDPGSGDVVVSEYHSAPFTERYLLMLEAHQRMGDGVPREVALARLAPEAYKRRSGGADATDPVGCTSNGGGPVPQIPTTSIFRSPSAPGRGGGEGAVENIDLDDAAAAAPAPADDTTPPPMQRPAVVPPPWLPGRMRAGLGSKRAYSRKRKPGSALASTRRTRGTLRTTIAGGGGGGVGALTPRPPPTMLAKVEDGFTPRVTHAHARPHLHTTPPPNPLGAARVESGVTVSPQPSSVGRYGGGRLLEFSVIRSTSQQLLLPPPRSPIPVSPLPSGGGTHAPPAALLSPGSASVHMGRSRRRPFPALPDAASFAEQDGYFEFYNPPQMLFDLAPGHGQDHGYGYGYAYASGQDPSSATLASTSLPGSPAAGPASPRCAMCPTAEAHAVDHWMWAGPPAPQLPKMVTKLTHVAADRTGCLRATFRRAIPVSHRFGTASSAIGPDYG